MKHFKLLCIAFLISITTIAQTNNETVKIQAEEYFSYLENNDFDNLLNSMYPQIFDSFPKDQLKAGMEQMFNNPGMKIEFLSNEVSSLSEAMKKDGKTYMVVFYNTEMKMTFVTEQGKPEEEKAKFLDLMKSSMAAQFGEENVTADVKETALVINVDANMFAISDASYDGWKFIGNDDTMKVLINSIIPEEVRTTLIKE